MALNYVPYEAWVGEPKPTFYKGRHDGEPCTIHWTGAPGGMPTSKQDTIQVLKGYRSSHMRRGWRDLGYHWAIGRDGTIFEGRGHNTHGAHCGDNSGNSKAGVLLFASQSVPGITNAQKDSLLALGQTFDYSRLMGHQEWSPTSCPGPVLMPWVRENRGFFQLGIPAMVFPTYGFEEMPYNLGGIGPGPTNDKLVFKYQWRLKAWRDARFDYIVSQHPTEECGKFRLDNGNYAIICWPAGRYGQRPRWMGYRSNETRDEVQKRIELRTGRKLRAFRDTLNSSGSYMKNLP